MSDDEYPDDSSKFGLRKGVIIGIVVICTSLSFTLGFFVGKYSGRGTEPSPALVDAAKPKSAVAPPVLQHETAPVNVVSQTPQLLVVEKAEEQKSEKTEVSRQEKAKKGAVAEKPEKTVSRDETAGKGPDKDYARVADSGGKGAAETRILYTVQIGAFKGKAEAENVKAKFDKKGYKTYITVVKDSGGKVYKVRTGEFTEKKDAEILSLKLKKTEGLSAFVTFRNE